MTQATQATLTEEEMIDNLYIMAEELQLQAMAINRRGLAQVHSNLFGHTKDLDFRLYASDAKFVEDKPAPEVLSKLDLKLRMYDFQDDEEKAEDYRSRIEAAQAFSQQLDGILETNRPLVAR